ASLTLPRRRRAKRLLQSHRPTVYVNYAIPTGTFQTYICRACSWALSFRRCCRQQAVEESKVKRVHGPGSTFSVNLTQ
ncbi:unnamed protein product, partial [Laminaria digitata]